MDIISDQNGVYPLNVTLISLFENKVYAKKYHL